MYCVDKTPINPAFSKPALDGEKEMEHAISLV